MLQLSESGTGPRTERQTSIVDPIFDLIASRKKLEAEWVVLYDQLQEAEFDAAKKHGHRPAGLIHWRDYTIGGSEIDTHRERLLAAGVDPATVEQEYLDAKKRYKAQLLAGPAWDKRTGLTKLSRNLDRALAAERRCAKRLSLTMPTTPAGAAALIQHMMSDDLVADETFWHLTALRTSVAALNKMSCAERSRGK